MKLTAEQLAALARLSRLHVDEGAMAELAEEMSKIMAMVEQVRQVDTSGVSDIVHIHDRPQPLRDDVAVAVSHHLAADAAVAQDGFVVVPQVIE